MCVRTHDADVFIRPYIQYTPSAAVTAQNRLPLFRCNTTVLGQNSFHFRWETRLQSLHTNKLLNFDTSTDSYFLRVFTFKKNYVKLLEGVLLQKCSDASSRGLGAGNIHKRLHVLLPMENCTINGPMRFEVLAVKMPTAIDCAVTPCGLLRGY